MYSLRYYSSLVIVFEGLNQDICILLKGVVKIILPIFKFVHYQPLPFNKSFSVIQKNEVLIVFIQLNQLILNLQIKRSYDGEIDFSHRSFFPNTLTIFARQLHSLLNEILVVFLFVSLAVYQNLCNTD